MKTVFYLSLVVWSLPLQYSGYAQDIHSELNKAVPAKLIQQCNRDFLKKDLASKEELNITIRDALKGDAEAQSTLGTYYEVVKPQCDLLTLFWLRKAAEQKQKFATQNLIMVLKRIGTPSALEEVEYWVNASK